MYQSTYIKDKTLYIDRQKIELPDGLCPLSVLSTTDWFVVVHAKMEPARFIQWLQYDDVGQDANLPSEVALKIARPSFLSKGFYNAINMSFDREARIYEAIERDGYNDESHTVASTREGIGKTLCSRHIVKVFGKVSTASGPILVMEYLPGGTLRDRLKVEGRLERHTAFRLFSEISQAVTCIHECPYEVVHCDIKPENVFFSADGTAKLGDLTSAYSRTTLHHGDGDFSGGTPQYLCPEYQPGQPVDFRCDIYALAVLLVEMLTGVNVNVRFRQMMSSGEWEWQEKTIVKELGELGISRKLADVLAKALLRDPFRRYTSVSEFHEAVREASEDRALVSPLLKLLPISSISFVPARRRERPHADTATMREIPEGEFAFGCTQKMIDKLNRWGYLEWNDPLAEYLPDSAVRLAPEICHPRLISIPTFHMDPFPVTNKEYYEFILAHPEIEVPYIDHPLAAPYNWDRERRIYPEGLENHPVVGITWYEARMYADWKGKRLPSEEEWEKAARGSATGKKVQIFPWEGQFNRENCNSLEIVAYNLERKDHLDVTDARRVFKWQYKLLQFLCDNPRVMTTDVRKFRDKGASPYGVADMAGNIMEWTDTPYFGGFRIVRSGSWLDCRVFCRVMTRRIIRPKARSPLIGFRCAASD